MFSTFIKESFIVSISKVLIAIINFILVYVYTHNLTIENYGLLELLFSFAQIVVVFFTLGLPSAFTRFYLLNKKKAEPIISTIYTIHFFLSTILLTLMLFFSIYFEEMYRSSFAPSILVILILVKQVLFSSSLLSQRYFLANKSFFKIETINLLYHIILLIVSFISLKLYNNDIVNLLLSHSIITFLYSAILYFLIFQKINIGFRITYDLGRQILLFALPFIPSAIAYFILTMSDRFFIKYFLSLESLALYSLAYKIVSVLTLTVITPVNIVFTQYVYTLAKDKNYKSIILLHDIIVKLYLLAAVTLVIVSPVIVNFLAPPEYVKSIYMVKLFIFSAILYGLNYFYVSGINISGKTQYQMYAIFIGMILNLILNYYFIQIFGLYGTIYSSILSFLLVVIITIYYSQKFYYLPFNFSKTFLSLVLVLLLTILIDNSFFLFREFDTQIRIILLILIIINFIKVYLDFNKVKNVS